MAGLVIAAKTRWVCVLSIIRPPYKARAHPPAFCGSNLRSPSTAHYQQPTINEASGSHCFVSKPDRAIRVIWEPITEMELIIPITNVIRRENVAAHYQDSYAKQSLGGKAMQPKAQSGPVTLCPIQSANCSMQAKGVCRAAREPEDLEACRVTGQPLCRTCQSRRAGTGWFQAFRIMWDQVAELLNYKESIKTTNGNPWTRGCQRTFKYKL